MPGPGADDAPGPGGEGAGVRPGGMDPKKDYYAILGVPEGATGEEIRKSFRRLAKKYHPDVNPGDRAAEAKFKEINEAHEVLSDPKKRAEYDAIRRGAFSGGGPFAWEGPGRGASGFGFGGAGFDIGDLFGDLFGGASGRFERTGFPGRDIEMEVPVDFLDMARGTVREIEYRRPRRCVACGGGGRTAGRRLCQACRGAGTTEAAERIRLKIPAGAADGATIRVPGKGEEGAGRAGDLVVTLRMIPHRYFRREGHDIVLDVPLSYSEAVRGAKIEVPTIDGPVSVTIPPGSSSGRRLRLKGRGTPVPGGSGRGDQYLVLQIVVPPVRTPEFLRLVERLAEYEGPNLRGGWN